MTADQHRQRIADALRAYANPPTPPRIRVIAAGVVDACCSHCGAVGPIGASIRRTCSQCRQHHVSSLCSTCCTALPTGWGDHPDLTDADKALLRRTAHAVGQRRGGR